MQGFLNILRALLRLTWRLAIVYVVFLILAWMLLGIHPREGARTTYSRIASIGHWITGFAGDVKDAGSGIAKMGARHLKDAQDRYHGIDPYEKVNEQLNQDMHP
ncbi:MAG: hypothetical protein IKV03_04110 [Alphaproteobacteria bacterium]|nr:hypothetical protein [Alphaproteobacteria bacterium]